MADKIEPALTPEEWAAFPNWPRATPASLKEAPLYYPSRPGIIAANNAALPDSDPRKITRADVTLLRRCRGFADTYFALELTAAESQRMQRLSDALESYLPPET